MNNKPSSSKSTYSTTSNNKSLSNVVSKLRRLKIEENLLVQSLQKLDQRRNYEEEWKRLLETDISCDLDYTNKLKKLNDSYIHAKNLFDDVKTVTGSQELLAELELDEIKKKVNELEISLKSFKSYVNVELNSLKTSEQELLKQLEDINIKEIDTIKRRKKIASVNYNDVVPSPVRLMMTTPFKCTEVQEFQDFMKNCSNRYGGWNEYHHNIFVKYWRKHFGDSVDKDFNDPLVETLAFENFMEESLSKLHGVGRESFIAHIDWYKKYLFHKDKQQRAINKWKSLRRSLRKASDKIVVKKLKEEKPNNLHSAGDTDMSSITFGACEYFSISQEKEAISHCATDDRQKSQCLDIKKKSTKETKPLRKFIGQDDIERFMKPTKQWLNRNHGYEDTRQDNINFIEDMEKLY